MRRCDDLIGSILRSVLATLFFIVSPLASAVSVDDWLSETHDGVFHEAELGECLLENGEVIEACRLTFRTYGRLAPDLGNIVLMPTWLNGSAKALASSNYLGLCHGRACRTRVGTKLCHQGSHIREVVCGVHNVHCRITR